MLRRVAIIAGFIVPLAVLLLWARFWLGLGVGYPGSVVRVVLPDGARLIGLPPVEGPPDASRPLVVIDAGHGGHDPGASGGGSLREKSLTLMLARAVRDALIADGRVRVALTRDSDRFLVLEERSGIAQRLGADLFVSIHADAAENGDATGATVYTLSDRASDTVAQQLAARENRSDMINGVVLGAQSNSVSSILVDLSRREMKEQSRLLSDLVLREGEGHLRFHAEPQREAAFVVLKSLDLPSILLEAGYISSPDDASNMANATWRKDFGKTVAGAIEIFLARQQAGLPSGARSATVQPAAAP
jgi:N-acetylmuramoyl-L-alanine amidase